MLSSFFNIPTKLKFKKFHKSSTFSLQPELSFISPTRGNVVVLKATTSGRLSSAHLEAARKVLRRKLKKTGTINSFAYPSISITKKPLAVRMGKGKGAVDSWIFPVRPGRLLFEVSNAPVELGAEALQMAGKKLPLASKVYVLDNLI